MGEITGNRGGALHRQILVVFRTSLAVGMPLNFNIGIGYLLNISIILSRLCFEAAVRSDLLKSNNTLSLSSSIIPSPNRSTLASGNSFLSSSACLSICLPITAPATPPTVAPIIAPRAVLPAARPMTAPVAAPPAVPITAPFCVLFMRAQPDSIIAVAIMPANSSFNVFISFNGYWFN